MRTEAEIRKRILEIKDAVDPNCNCSDCFGNLTAMCALQWTVGDYDPDPRAEEEIAARAAMNRMK